MKPDIRRSSGQQPPCLELRPYKILFKNHLGSTRSFLCMYKSTTTDLIATYVVWHQAKVWSKSKHQVLTQVVNARLHLGWMKINAHGTYRMSLMGWSWSDVMITEQKLIKKKFSHLCLDEPGTSLPQSGCHIRSEASVRLENDLNLKVE